VGGIKAVGCAGELVLETPPGYEKGKVILR
jgi:hypothetical protein